METIVQQDYRKLGREEIKQLVAQGCSAEDWNNVLVAEPFLVERVRHADFAGKVRIGSLEDAGEQVGSRSWPAGIYHALVRDCVIGNGVRVAQVAGHLSGYHLGDGSTIENIGVMETFPDSQFGAGIEVAVLNEAGGREVPLFNELSAQFAHLVCLYRYRDNLIRRLQEMALAAAEANRRDYGIVGAGAKVVGVPRMVGVDIGPAAVIDGVQSLVNGTILSHPKAPTTFATGVIAEDFLVAEGATVSGGAILERTFVGQASRIGKQFSAENCLFFANCEAFHGEGCSVLAGPYTVTHHKSTLLIGGLFSFFNAGSATNQSNHRYKLGPTHEGKLERGCKTGSSSYVMWPCHVGPFSVVLGKHTRSFDTTVLPFSHLEANSSGKCELIPGHYIATVGTLRDGSKWPQRDRRRGPHRRDVICFDVFSPLTTGRMQRGLKLLEELIATADRSVDTVAVGGVEIKRVLLRTGRKRYSAYLERYLLDQIVRRAEHRKESGARSLREVFEPDDSAVYSEEWIDLGGQLMPAQRLEELCDCIVSGEVNTAEQLQQACSEIYAQYERDVWIWARTKAGETGLVDWDDLSQQRLTELAHQYCEQQGKFLRLVLVDAQREFDEVSQTGFGVDGGAEAVQLDFTAVRGRYEENSFVQTITAEIEDLPSRCDRVCAALAGLE